MKITTKIIQILLALWFIAGAMYMMGNFEFLASEAASTWSQLFWVTLGVVQILLALTLLIGAFWKKAQSYVPVVGLGLIIITLGGLYWYSAYKGFSGSLWAIVPALLLGWVVYFYKAKS
jgi:hypothetical protein